MKQSVSTHGSDVVLVLKAAAFAAHKHRDQRRKDVKATPYINHPLAVAQALCEEGDVDDPIILAAALLHDTIEDTETTYVELRGQFGARIADIVAEVTDTKFLGKREYFDWAKAVLDQIRQSDPRLAERFDAVWEAGR